MSRFLSLSMASGRYRSRFCNGLSKDSDLHQRSFMFGHPPKLVWVRIGNCSTADVERLLRYNFAVITVFDEDSEAAFLALS